jgi:hypothetical protein
MATNTTITTIVASRYFRVLRRVIQQNGMARPMAMNPATVARL